MNLPSVQTSFPWVGFGLLLILLALPVASFCISGWQRRRDCILNSFNDEAAREYLCHFHAWEPRPADAPKRALLDYYNKQFSRQSFLAPALILLGISACLLAPCVLSVATWLESGVAEQGIFPLVVVLAIAGGYMWVLFDLIQKSFSELLLPRDLYWSAFRLVICVPAGYAIGKAFSQELELPIAFCLGALPTKSILTLLRRIAGKAGLLQAKDQSVETEIQLLPGIDLQKAETFLDEGITSICQLANADPVRLAIRTGLSFGYVVGVIGDAILWSYLCDREHACAFRLCGLNGAYDCRLLLYDLWESSHENDRSDAAAVVAHLATTLKVPEGGVLNLLWNVAYDPTADCIFAIWG